MRSPETPDGGKSARRTLEELQQRNAELTAAVAARDTFIAVAAHELRNPMTPMIGQIDLLLRGLRAGRYTQQIEQRLERTARDEPVSQTRRDLARRVPDYHRQTHTGAVALRFIRPGAGDR